jgi:acetyl/propionyl-CoA carboxylase alpha subunit
VEYDPILSKLIAHAENRNAAIQRMIQALESYVILGIRTAIPFLIDVLRSEAFVAGETFTDFVSSHFAEWKPERTDADMACIAYIIDDLAGQKKTTISSTGAGEIVSPWQSLGNWRR